MAEQIARQSIDNRSFGGERALYRIAHTDLDTVRFLPGESALKHAHDIAARGCEFLGKYPFWHAERVDIEDCLFAISARAAIWYAKDIAMRNALVEAPKSFRQVSKLLIEDSRFPNAGETLWSCSDVTVRNAAFNGADYIFMNGRNIDIDNCPA